MALQYIIQVICFQALFLAVYYLLLRKETFFSYNRIYLLVTPVIALALPFIKIAMLQTVVPVETFASVLPEVVIGDAAVITSTDTAPVTESFTIPWLQIYMVGVVISLVVLIIKIKKFTSYFSYKQKGSSIIEIPSSTEAFTFFNYIFIGADIDTLSRKQILTHEQIHAKQGHTWDLIFFEILKVVLWFNPITYLYQKNLSIVHEYLADQKATEGISKYTYYEELLNTAFGTSKLSFTNTFFNQSLIKKRIVMLQKSKSQKSALAKYLLLIPLVLAMLVYVSCSEDNGVENEQTLEQQILELKLAIEDRESLTAEELKKLQSLRAASVNGIKGSQIIEVVEQQEAYNLNEANQDEIIEVLEVERVYDVDENGNIPFAVIDEVPVFPGCESLTSNEQLRKCMSQKVSALISANFNVALGKELNLKGTNRIFASFKIDKNGFITNLRTRSPHPDLDAEAQRVISMLPKMKPGKHNGEVVGVLYSLPITFQIAE
ncbi:M56 family metallopeptidase [uncultured Dokdonia sp.]|uniref:M56 family metallopeptidase n=1 Tax=uncultured Dokdonia sp. TaxID=575653 RepID=UPI0026123F9F|nr:M56 family metallopeptidase [uncultured Dokdonia sp.]